MPASIELKNGIYYTRFSFNGKQHKRSLQTDKADEAQADKALIDQTLRRIKTGEIIVPADVDAADFIRSGGRLVTPAIHRQGQITLDEMMEGFLESSHHTGKAGNTRVSDCIHIRHFLSSEMHGKRLAELSEQDLLNYIDRRKSHGVVGRTIKAEMALLRSVWNGYGMSNRLVPSEFRVRFPRKLAWPKYSEKPAFTTLDKAKTKEEMRSVYLRKHEVLQLIKLVRERQMQDKYEKTYGWVSAAVQFCLYTGARRSSMILQKVSDIDFDNSTIRLLVRKENRNFQMTSRVVPLLFPLQVALWIWLSDHPDDHPGGDVLFTDVKNQPLTAKQAHLGLAYYLLGTKFQGLGWHCLRHSFVSIAAAKGIALDSIAQFTGHHSDDVARLYRHLEPNHVGKQFSRLYSPGKAKASAIQERRRADG